jgi:adenylylsulfate kinase
MNPCVIWFTGLSGSGKSTLSEAYVQILKDRQIKVEYLDGDAIRSIFPQTGFTREERDRHVRWVGYLASRLENQGVVVVASFVSPHRESRDFARKLAKKFIEIYVSTPVEECEKRDVKGLYAKARRGEIPNFTGISDPYESPLNAELSIDTSKIAFQECLNRIEEICGVNDGSFARARR